MVLATRKLNLALIACLCLACGDDEGVDQDDLPAQLDGGAPPPAVAKAVRKSLGANEVK